MKPAYWIVLLFLLAFPIPSHAEISVKNMRMWRGPDHTRLVFDLSGPLQHRLFGLKDPDRIVIDMERAVLREPLPALDFNGPFLSGVRSGRPARNTLRIVLDLRKPTHPRTFVLKPNKLYGHRLVIDLFAPGKRESAVVPTPAKIGTKELVVAIDAGHGGEDFGAVGRNKTREKDVVLGIARYLSRLVNAAPGMRGILTRNGDYYISLQGRVRAARRQRADLFVSIHADYFPRSRVTGASVYALSQRGATSTQAKILADKENAADLFGGVSISDKDDLLAKVLLDLSMTQTISDSLEFGTDMLSALGRVGPIHISRVEQAGFAVLKSADVPSILIETAYISNPRQERLLRSRSHQRKIARAIFRGIERYLARGKIRKVIVASKGRRYVVKRGDTLTHIARRYRVSLATLRSANGIKGNLLRIGEVLNIPATETGG